VVGMFCQVLCYGGFYRLARRYLDYGLDQMLGSIFISRSVKELQKYVPQVGFLADQMHAWLHLHLQISQGAPEVCPSGRISGLIKCISNSIISCREAQKLHRCCCLYKGLDQL
jgi:hypothetical protein